MMKKVISLFAVRRCLENSRDYFEHLQNAGILDNLSEEDQRRYRAIFSEITEVSICDWTINYY